jgi:hypothetical protein
MTRPNDVDPWIRRALATAGALLLMLGFILAVPVQAGVLAADPDEIAVGRRIYQDGILPLDAALKGVRGNGVPAEGAAAACANCHRRSGMGSVEGDMQVSPVSGDALFGTGVVINMDPRSGKRFNRAHAPYTDETVAQAIRNGVTTDGQPMNPMMPRYALADAQMKALIAYLKQLSRDWSPGVTQDQIRFATVITPGVDPERRKIFVDMMQGAFFQKNSSTALATRPTGRRHMAGAAEFVLGTERKWTLAIWELEGPPATWARQLDEHYRREPVFAIVSGLASGTWEPVQDFCEREQVPCWFPSVELAPDSTEPTYSLYFSRGVALEAAVLAHQVLHQEGRKPRRVVQIYRDTYVASGAAGALTRALASSGVSVVDRVLSDADPESLRRALGDLEDQDTVIAWLRPVDVAALDRIAPPNVAAIYFSGSLSKGERGPFPASWKSAGLRVVYPYELPEKRSANLAYFRAWLNRIRVRLVDEPFQSEVYFALTFLRDTTAEMLDNLYRDYLLERGETMITRREIGRAEEEVRTSTLATKSRFVPLGQAVEPGAIQAAGLVIGKREGTTIYPRLGLGPGQRFASKGAYIVRFAAADSDKLITESDWIVP